MENNFALKIKELRNDLNLTQTDFSERLGVTQAALSAYEKGTRNPTFETIMSISKEFNVSLDWLCGFSKEKKLTPKIATYADLFKQLVDLCSLSYSLNGDELEKSVLELSIVKDSKNTHFIVRDDPNFISFFTEWNKMYNLLKSGTIDEELYSLWLEKELPKYSRPINGVPF